MGTFQQAEALRRPPGSCLVSPRAFADTYADRPTDEICIGLRTIADSDIDTARAQAAKWATKLHPDVSPNDGEKFGPWVETYNDSLMRWVIARGTCDPNDVTQPPEAWNIAPEDQVREALTSDGVRYIYDEWERMRLTVDPIRREATDDEVLAELPRLLPFAGRLASPPRGRLRRLLGYVIDELAQVAPTEPPTQ